MLIGIISDLHANLEATQAVFAKLDAIGPDRIVCLGDVAGYGANPNEVIDIVREREITTLMGNHDASACGLEEPWFFNSKAQAAIYWQAGRIRPDNRDWLRGLPSDFTFADFCLAVHGAPGNRDDYIYDWLDAMQQLEFLDGTSSRVCFFGHSHLASLFGEKGNPPFAEASSGFSLNRQNRYFINPGSVGQPRDGDSRAAFGVLRTDTMRFEFERAEYDIQTTARKIVEAGLPPSLARRLSRGR